MGESVVILFAVLAGLALLLLAAGLVRRSRVLLFVGGSLLVSALGAWLLGPFGVFLGFVVVPFGRRGGPGAPGEDRP